AKLANILFAGELQRRCDERGVPILSMSVDPGATATGRKRGTPLARTRLPAAPPPTTSEQPLQGAATQLFAATSPIVREQAEEWKVRYVVPPGRVEREEKMAEVARDGEIAERLWWTTESVVQEVLEKGSL
ncbi:hypothetical protein CALCODRAFT_444806, partial [Calocera cornea HHB12733]